MSAEYGEPLTERQLEIVALVAEGLTNREIAAQLYISHNTVKVHLRNIFTKTGVVSRTELSMLALREGWVSVARAKEDLAPVKVEVVDGEEEEAAEEGTGEETAEGEGAFVLPSWPRERWVALALGLVLAFGVLLLPARRPVEVGGQGSLQALVDQPVGNEPVPVAAEGDGWVELPPLPVRRARFGVTTLGGEIYVVGGLTEEGLSNRLDVYDIEAQQWRAAAPRPLALANVQAVTLEKGGVLVPGGCDAEGQPVSTVHRYAPQDDRWVEVAPLPEPLCAYALTIFEGQVYLFGGWNGRAYRAVAYRYNAEGDTWTELPAPAEARGFGAAAVLGDRVFYVGGYDGGERSICEVYFVEEERWGVCASLLQPRGGLGLAALGGQLFAVGGGWENYLGFSERYNLKEDAWFVMGTPLVGEWRNLGVVSWETALYALGGWSGDYLNRTYMLEVLPFRVFIPVTLP
ncbi:MAG: Kelch repeat-containing protein [Anaerolineae bacterium]